MSLKKKTRTFDSIKETNEPSSTTNTDLIPNGGAVIALNCVNHLSKKQNEMTLSDKRNQFKSLNSKSLSSVKTHFSPQTSVRIKVIDEVDGDS